MIAPGGTSAPNGKTGSALNGLLRAVWLAGNPVQARMGADGRPHGPAVDLAEAIAARAGSRLEITGAAGAHGVLARVRSGEADIGFVAYDPARSEGVTFSPAYLLSLNRFAVPGGSPIRTQDEVDRAGVRLGAILNDAGGLFLQRTIRTAELKPVADVEAGLLALRGGTLDAFAANGQRLADLLRDSTDITVLPGSFFGVPQTVAVREDDVAMARLVASVVEEQLGSGAVASSIARAGLTGAEAAVPGQSPNTPSGVPA